MVQVSFKNTLREYYVSGTPNFLADLSMVQFKVFDLHVTGQNASIYWFLEEDKYEEG